MSRSRMGRLLPALSAAVFLAWLAASGADRLPLLLFTGLALLFAAVNIRSRREPIPSRGESPPENGAPEGSFLHEAPPPPPPPARLRDPVRIYKTFRPPEVMMVKMLLEGEGIPFVAGNEYFGSLYPNADGMASVEILVERSDLELARRVLAPLLKGAERET